MVNDITFADSCGFTIGVGMISYISTLFSLSFPSYFTQKIRSQNELENVVNEEALLLGLDPKKIKCNYNEFTLFNFNNGCENFVQQKKNHYQLQVSKSFLDSNRATVRHELYHIKKGDLKNNSMLKYYFINEPRAILYGSFKIQL
mgnify:CR=1 FL=1|jgi:hypothetical protein